MWTSRRLRRPLDDLRFSNSMTVEHNVLGPGSIGHLLRHCTYSTTTHARTDRWYHYDQVGSVVCESTSSDIPSMYHRYADAWGNEMSGYTTGEWTSTWASRDGWGHNTKEYDGDSGLVYMYQRWYQPELGVFMSQAPYPVMMEHEYSFARMTPSQNVDPKGMLVDLGGSDYDKCMSSCMLRASKEGGGFASEMEAAMALIFCDGLCSGDGGDDDDDDWGGGDDDDFIPPMPDMIPPGNRIPVPIPEPVGVGCDDPCGEWLVDGAIVAGAGYLLYRACRMAPSVIFPPLWPTIPANAVIP